MLTFYAGDYRPRERVFEAGEKGVRMVEYIPPKSYPSKSHLRPDYITTDVRAIIWRVYEKLKTRVHDRDVAWYDTGFSASGPSQAEWIAKILGNQNPDYEYLVSL